MALFEIGKILEGLGQFGNMFQKSPTVKVGGEVKSPFAGLFPQIGKDKGISIVRPSQKNVYDTLLGSIMQYSISDLLGLKDLKNELMRSQIDYNRARTEKARKGGSGKGKKKEFDPFTDYKD